jgi:SagB-type dehydrogenase family enzyme
VLVKAAGTASLATLINVLGRYGGSSAATRQVVDWLLEHFYLVVPDDKDAMEQARELERWQQAGWWGAAGYHFLTYGYPFEQYGAYGRSEEDTRRMRAYSRAQPDLERARSLGATALATEELPRPTADLIRPDGDGAGFSITADYLTSAMLNALLAILACPVGEAYPPWPNAAKVMLKTSPSGGCRHPTEVYCLVSAVSEVVDGWHHVDCLDCRLEMVSRVVDPDEQLRQILPGAHVPDGSWALLVYTSVFERNRYRYREPRTFRTVHMDVGHVMITCEYLTQVLGLRSAQFLHPVTAAAIEALQLDRLVEAPMAATLLWADPRNDR